MNRGVALSDAGDRIAAKQDFDQAILIWQNLRDELEPLNTWTEAWQSNLDATIALRKQVAKGARRSRFFASLERLRKRLLRPIRFFANG